MTSVGLVHGLGGTAGTMHRIAEMLTTRGHTCTAVTLPGHGSSPDDLLAVGWSDWVAAVPVAEMLVGQSMGASLCLAAASTRKDVRSTVRAVVAINAPAPDPDAVEGLEWRRSRGHEWLEAPPLAEGEAGYDRLPMHALLEMTNGVLATDFAGITVPVLLVNSALDDVVDPWSAEVIAPLLGGPVERLVLPRSGHVATLGPDLDLLVDAVHIRCD